MKKMWKKMFLIIMVMTLAILVKTNQVNAAGASIQASTMSPKQGQTVTVTGSVTAGAWNLILTGAGQTQNILGQTNSPGNESASKSISFTAGSPGTTYVFSLSGGMTDFSADKEEQFNKSITITVAQTNPPPIEEVPDNRENIGGNSNTGTTTKKSNNANLTNLGIKPNDFSGFRQNTTSYSVTVPENVESVEVYATKADAKSEITGTGKRTLKKGANALAVTVTAEDGTKKTYTINVTRQGEEEKPEENTTPDEKTDEEMPEETQNKNGLSGLTIGDLKLTPSFDTEVYEYKIKYIGEDTKLQINAQPTDENYVVDITGNEDLKKGENLITILVSDKEGNNIATYQVTVEKSLVDEEAIAKEQAEKEKQQKMIIIGAIVAVVIIAIIIFLIIRRRRNRQWAEDYSGIPFAGINEEDIEDEFDDENTQTQNYIENEPSKDNLRQNYLNGYDDSYSDDYEDEKPKRKKGKGKRFK